MKKIILCLIVGLLLINILPVSLVLSTTAQEFLEVITDGVNMRSSPGTDNPILTTLSKSTYLLNLGSAKDKKGTLWYKVYDFNSNKTGYVASYLLKKTNITITGSDANFTCKVITDFLNVRTGPGTEFNFVKRLNFGTKISVVRIIKRSDGFTWYKYKDGNNFYFVASWYTKVEETTPSNNNNQNNKNQNNPSTPTQTGNSPTNGTALDFVNLRKGPSTDYEKITLVNKGDQINIVGFAKNHLGELWLECLYNGNRGFVISDYFKYDVNKVNLDLSSVGATAKTVDSVNLRTGPQTTYDIALTVPKDTSLKIVGTAKNKEGENWFEVEYMNKFYFVRSDTVTLTKKEKGVLQNALWEITSDGIDIKITGTNLPNPNITLVNDPIRLLLTYQDTILLNSPSQYELNLFPFTRIAINSSSENAIITIYLLSEIPYSFESKGSNLQLLHFKLPKENEELVEIGGSPVFANIQKIDNNIYLSLDDFLNFFNMTLGDNYTVDFFKNIVSIDKEKLKKINNENYISLNDLSITFNVSVTSSNNAVYIDPILKSINKTNSGFTLTFTFPTKAKKISQGNFNYIVFYADCFIKSDFTINKRNGAAPPEIYVPITQNDSLIVSENVVEIKKEKQKEGILSNRIIVIDPGHGSYSGQYLDVGAIGYSGTKEAYIVLDIALRLKKLLEDAGATVILTHSTVDDPKNPTLKERVSIANSSSGDLFISIHLNASTNKDASGTETYYWYDSSKRLASTIQDALVSSLNTYDRGIKKDYLYVCREVTTMPAILTEVAFITNPKEESLLKDPNFLDKVANALFQGIVRYLNGQ